MSEVISIDSHRDRQIEDLAKFLTDNADKISTVVMGVVWKDGETEVTGSAGKRSDLWFAAGAINRRISQTVFDTWTE